MADDTSEQKKALSENQGEDNLNKPNKLKKGWTIRN